MLTTPSSPTGTMTDIPNDDADMVDLSNDNSVYTDDDLLGPKVDSL